MSTNHETLVKIVQTHLDSNPKASDAELFQYLKVNGVQDTAERKAIIEEARAGGADETIVPIDEEVTEGPKLTQERPQATERPTPHVEPQTPQPAKPAASTAVSLPATERYADEARIRALSFLNPVVYQGIKTVASDFFQSGALPQGIKNVAQLVITLQAGVEAGLRGPVEAMNSIMIVNGRPTMWGDMVIAKVMEAGHRVEWGECNDKTATCTITRGDNGMKFTKTVTIEEAIAKGWTKARDGSAKDFWTKYPDRMLMFKAFHFCRKFICPDALRGITEREEMEDQEDMPHADYVQKPQERMKPSVVTSEAPKARKSLKDALNGTVPEPKVKKEKKPKKQAK